MKKIDIELQSGNTLEIEYVEEFIDKVRTGLGLLATEEITEKHIKKFIFESFKSAVDKAENSGYMELNVDQTSFQ